MARFTPVSAYTLPFAPLDLILAPFLAKVPIRETWEALEELADEGVAKNIGVSNFQGGILIDLLRYARIQPAALQVELHPYLAQKKLVALTKELGIALTAYSSLGPASYVELSMHQTVPNLLSHDTIASIASEAGKSELLGLIASRMGG